MKRKGYYSNRKMKERYSIIPLCNHHYLPFSKGIELVPINKIKSIKKYHNKIRNKRKFITISKVTIEFYPDKKEVKL